MARCGSGFNRPELAVHHRRLGVVAHAGGGGGMVEGEGLVPDQAGQVRLAQHRRRLAAGDWRLHRLRAERLREGTGGDGSRT